MVANDQSPLKKVQQVLLKQLQQQLPTSASSIAIDDEIKISSKLTITDTVSANNNTAIPNDEASSDTMPSSIISNDDPACAADANIPPSAKTLPISSPDASPIDTLTPSDETQLSDSEDGDKTQEKTRNARESRYLIAIRTNWEANGNSQRSHAQHLCNPRYADFHCPTTG